MGLLVEKRTLYWSLLLDLSTLNKNIRWKRNNRVKSIILVNVKIDNSVSYLGVLYACRRVVSRIKPHLVKLLLRFFALFMVVC